jgi:hypothetical protein
MSSLLEYEFWVSVSFTFPSNGFRVLKFDVIFWGFHCFHQFKVLHCT